MLKSFTPLVNSRVDNVLVKMATDMNQPLFQFINALDVCRPMVWSSRIWQSTEYGLLGGQKSSGMKSSFFLCSSLTVSRVRYAGALSCRNAFKWH